MSFLTLNGWAVNILKGGERSPIVIGDDGRAFDGTLLRDRRVIKNRWRYTTREIQANDANALVGLLLGQGDRWGFDDSAMSSDKGLGKGATVGSFRWGESTDTTDTAIQSSVDASVDESKFGEGSVAADPATTNLLTQSQRQAGSTAGFAVVTGGAIATDTTYYLPTGESTPTSVKHTRTATKEGLITNATAIAAATDYSASVYVCTADSGVTVQVRLIDDTAPIVVDTFALTASTWRRCELSGTSAGGATTAQIEVTVDSGAAAGVIYTDAWQLEQQTYPTTWADGARAAVDLTYSGAFLDGAKGMTFAAWVRMPTTGAAAANRHLIDIKSDDLARLNVFRPTAGAGLTAFVGIPDGSTSSLAYATTIWDDDWHHIAVVYGKDGQTGNTFLKIYVDGSEVATKDIGTVYPEFDTTTEIYPGNKNAGTAPLGAESLLDELYVFPYAAAAGQIAAMAAMTAAGQDHPALLAEGDSIETPHGVVVEGAVSSRGYGGLVLSGDWHSTAQRITFELEQR